MKKNKLVGFVAGAFDLLHCGHIMMFKEAKKQANVKYLIVGLQTNPSIDRPGIKNKPVQSVIERFFQLESVKYIDKIIPYETEEDLENLFKILPINIRIIGEEYLDIPFTGKDICLDKHIKIYYNNRKHKFSTTELRSRVATIHDKTLFK